MSKFRLTWCFYLKLKGCSPVVFFIPILTHCAVILNIFRKNSVFHIQISAKQYMEIM